MSRIPAPTPAEGVPSRTEPRAYGEESGPIASKARGTRDNVRLQRPDVSREAEVFSLVHDARTPLAIIVLETQMIEREVGADATPKMLCRLERIAQNAAYIERLFSDLLDLSSIEGDRLELRRERVDLASLIAETLSRAVSSVDRSRVSIDVCELMFVDADPARLERVLANLVGNALKYSPGSAVTIQLARRGDQACVAVIDAGPGLTADEAASVFERYQRTQEGRTHEGYGLGLYICRRIIDAHGGRIGVTSTPGKGSRFFFELLALTE